MIRAHAALVILSAFLLTGCDTDDAQNEFEAAAFAVPFEGITRTSDTGEVDEDHVDEDDWRISPLYTQYVEISQPAYPNPTPGQRVNLEVYLRWDDALNGDLAIYTRTDDLSLRRLDAVPNPNISDFYTFSIPASALRQEQGIARLYVFDDAARDLRLISYGDVRIR